MSRESVTGPAIVHEHEEDLKIGKDDNLFLEDFGKYVPSNLQGHPSQHG